MKREWIEVYLKGLLMGLADIIPGVSGGTIAFITGIYERLINAIKSFDPRLAFLWLLVWRKEERSEFIELLQKMDFLFLLVLLSGIMTSFLIASRYILLALNQYPVYTYSFFLGLIAASSLVVYRKVEVFDVRTMASGIGGFLAAFWVTGISGALLPHTPPVIFFSGFVAITAMLLPGISGSFILLILGQYEYMLGVLKNLDYIMILIFISGAVLSLLLSSRFLAYLLKRYRQPTISMLVGLMVGALRLPVERVIFVRGFYPELGFIWNTWTLTVSLFFILLGVIIILTLERD